MSKCFKFCTGIEIESRFFSVRIVKLTGGQVARRRRRPGGGAWGGVFPPVHMVIANPHGGHGAKKTAKLGVGDKNNYGLNGPNPRQLSPWIFTKNEHLQNADMNLGVESQPPAIPTLVIAIWSLN